MRTKHLLTTTSDALERRQQWADYIRIRRLPEKKCRKCHRELPNNRKFFTTNNAGRLSCTCIDCASIKPLRGRLRGLCSICLFEAKLVNDKAATAPQLVCYGCLKGINWLAMIGPAGTVRVGAYFTMHRKNPGAGGPRATPTELLEGRKRL